MEYFTHADALVMNRLWSAAGPAVFVGLYFLIGLVAYGVRCTIYGRFRDAEIDARGSSVLLDNWARTYFAWVMRPVWHFLQSAEIPPNAVTSVSVLLAIAAGVAAAVGQFSLGGWLYFAREPAISSTAGWLADHRQVYGQRGGAGLHPRPLQRRCDADRPGLVLSRYVGPAGRAGLPDWFVSRAVCPSAGRRLGHSPQSRAHATARTRRDPGHCRGFQPPGGSLARGAWRQPFYWLTVLAVTLLAVSTQFTAAHRLLATTNALEAQSGPVHLRVGRSSLEPVWMGLSVGFDFLLVLFMVGWLGWPAWWATALGSLSGTALQFVLSRAWTLDRGGNFDTHAQQPVLSSAESAVPCSTRAAWPSFCWCRASRSGCRGALCEQPCSWPGTIRCAAPLRRPSVVSGQWSVAG